MSRIVESLYRISGIELNEDFDYLDLDNLSDFERDDLECEIADFIEKQIPVISDCFPHLNSASEIEIEMIKDEDNWGKLENVDSIFKNLESGISSILNRKVTYQGTEYEDESVIVLVYTIDIPEVEVTPLIKALDEHCIENWKEHANAPVPKSNPEKINVYDFDEDEYEPLRPKLYDCKPVSDGLYIYWLGQESGYISDGMYNEIERWAKTIRDKYCKGEHTKIFLKTENRDGTESDEAVIEI